MAHDIERAFRDPSKEPATKSEEGFKGEFFTKYHPEKGAEIVGEVLTKEDAPLELINRVKALIAKHEVEGTKIRIF